MVMVCVIVQNGIRSETSTQHSFDSNTNSIFKCTDHHISYRDWMFMSIYDLYIQRDFNAVYDLFAHQKIVRS